MPVFPPNVHRIQKREEKNLRRNRKIVSVTNENVNRWRWTTTELQPPLSLCETSQTFHLDTFLPLEVSSAALTQWSFIYRLPPNISGVLIMQMNEYANNRLQSSTIFSLNVAEFEGNKYEVGHETETDIVE
jgi:hypothetical protein